MSMSSLNPGFVAAIERNLAFWRHRLTSITDLELSALVDEQSNIVRGIQLGLQTPTTRLSAARLARAAFFLAERCGQWEMWLAVYQQCACGEPIEDDPYLQLRLLNRYGQLLRLSGQTRRALVIHHLARRQALARQEARALAVAHFNLGEGYRELGQLQRAEQYGRQALAYFQPLPGARRWLAATLNAIGLVAWQREEAAEAEAWFAQAVTQWRSLADPTELARVLNNLGLAVQAQEKWVATLRCYREALDLLGATASVVELARVHNNLGRLHFAQGRYPEAESCFRQADAPALRRTGDFRLRASVSHNLGNVLVEAGRGAEALPHLERARVLWAFLADNVMLANTLGTLGEALESLARPEEARARYAEALALLVSAAESPLTRWLRQTYQARWSRLVEEARPLTETPVGR